LCLETATYAKGAKKNRSAGTDCLYIDNMGDGDTSSPAMYYDESGRIRPVAHPGSSKIYFDASTEQPLKKLNSGYFHMVLNLAK